MLWPPARLKMTQPRYQEIASRLIPEVRRDRSVIRVIAGVADV
jgi:redox-sensitive bicupin YhaK (pirin superfamily)